MNLKIKVIPSVFLIVALLCGIALKAHGDQKTGPLLFPFVPPEMQSNIVVLADLDHPLICLPEYTNVLGNTNLFTVSENKLMREVTWKYINVTTNLGPEGTVFASSAIRERVFQGNKSIFPVVCFTHKNSGAKEEIASFYDDPRYIVARFRDANKDGYDVLLIDGQLIQFQQFKAGVLDGLYLAIKPADSSAAGHCGTLARFKNGKLFGKFLGWDDDGRIIMEAEFKMPFDLLKYQIVKTDLSWTEPK